MFYDNNAPKKVGNVFEYILVASQRTREINIQRNNTGENSQLRDKNSKREYPHQQAAREITEGTVGREYLRKVKSRDYKTKMR